jgi:aerobic carbon-monoxide dehydrogenase large subunit
MAERLFGARVRRREDARLVTGRGRYVADVALPGLLHVAVHRSPHAHARIVALNAEEARRRPGVVRVLVPADVAALGRLPVLVPHASLVTPACPEILPQQVVSYAGQPVALVVAESVAAATDALDALRVDYEPLPAVASLDDALRPDAPRVHPGGNVLHPTAVTSLERAVVSFIGAIIVNGSTVRVDRAPGVENGTVSQERVFDAAAPVASR